MVKSLIYFCLVALFTMRVMGTTVTISQGQSITSAIAARTSGDTILCNTGIYTAFSTSGQFSASDPLVIKSSTLHGARIQSGDKANFYNAHGIVFEGFEIDGTNMSSNSGLVQVSATSSDITIKNCHIYNGSYDADCIKINQTSRVNVIGCDLHDPGLRVDGTAQETLDLLDCNGGLISGNVFRTITEPARQYVNAKGGSRDIIFENNIFLHAKGMEAAVMLGGYSDPIYINGQFEGVNITARNNIIIGSTRGSFVIVNVDGAYIYNNLSYGCSSPNINFGQGGGTGLDGGNRNIYAYNNVFFNCGMLGKRPMLAKTEAITIENFVHDNNCFWNSGEILASDRTFSPAREAAGVLTDPLLSIDTSGTDYAHIMNSISVAAGSPLVNGGAIPDTACPGIPFDIKGAVRPLGGAYDIGPLEQAGTAAEKTTDRDMKPGITIAPNPFNPATRISVSGLASLRGQSGLFAAGSEMAAMNVFNMHGTLVQKLSAACRQLPIGITWDASHLPSGVYTIVVTAGSLKLTEKAILLK
ncbi:MAG: hypothetical protein A2268_06995 [Candidatus Raymondbacteria bacterium RifOxyA12_full_50_37]|uniref:Right handed beta helix domain-containing protein n=1 Tax=Candidatus Raymondbacteria bacterium RIFOXYD12_FULL_49_13 TaxID=1817890 RepID=A0A1F7FEA6_UNCRA|nr:MAG: hypothetical protein A2268_06995 [Candidatus Raymondbacteria bacterium RifOxyA12_full_50_37]OGJ91131.1 MAG: hypothetical protein A2248_01145 [Candidatus Raymondbacteria bacterium RIFOXYA2_FULL_49_16]OGJ97529.1 MAG: hypothetical protein A2453_01910 [Candidatus Raymondbacteria bacterium RIFOXYC2_FULL_50_21]OGK00167.1 MAG: hypothetical protein A2350_16390 [Candidatus Raymondbacteria bacterium RifOxyB12_full_50_8]OGK05004.1 MAG: hypothetical protein A2519_10020 [Candidatus Raymondbacteria b